MRYGGDSLKTLDNVHERVDYIRKYHILPPGMDIEPYYDRANLVELTTHTVLENLLVGMVLVALVLWLFLGHGRAALITALNIPLALMIAFIGMVATGTPANLISLGAVDFGIVVDSTVIMMENIFRHLGRARQAATMIERILLAAAEVGPPMFFSTLVIAVAFIPLFTLTGVAGVIFSPMAHTYAFAIGGAIVLALTLTPVLAERGLKIASGRPAQEENRLDARRSTRALRPALRLALTAPARAGQARAVPIAVVARRWRRRSWGASSCPSSRRATSGSAPRCRCRSRSSSRRSTSAACARSSSVPRTSSLRPRAPRAPGGDHGGLAARAPRRRHRRLRLLQHRAVRAAQPVRRVAARRDQGVA